MYARHCRFLPLTTTTTAVLVIFLMMVTMQRVYSLGVLRIPSTRRRIASAVSCPYTTCRRAAPLAWVSHQSSSSTDRRRRRRQNQGVDSAPLRALFASSSLSSSSSSSSAATGTDSNHKTGMIRLVLDTAQDTEELGALLCTFLLAEEEQEQHEKDKSSTAESSSSSASSAHPAAGSVIFLQGDLGAGKTCLARGFVRAAVQDWDQRVTSPTYLLSNVYQTGSKLESDQYYLE
jgi:hypothetical protein